MPQDDREMLELLKFELKFLQMWAMAIRRAHRGARPGYSRTPLLV